MKSAIAFSVVSLVSAQEAAQPNYHSLWQEFKQKYEKVYEAAGEEEARFNTFMQNVDKVHEENEKGYSYELGINNFADMSQEEFSSMYIGGYRPDLRSPVLESLPWLPSPNRTAPASIDWVSKGAVTKVKNQAKCGSCWAFSTTGALEGALFVASDKLVSLSEEELVQCDQVDQGCQGGLMDNGFKFVKEHGLCTETSYPYTSGPGIRGTCKHGCNSVVTLTGFTDVPSLDENALKLAVAQQPVSVAIEADKMVFQLYRGGVLNKPGCGNKLDHGVLVVGYGVDNGVNYWKVKNSWGPSWGENGYIRLHRGSNYCGIATQPVYPTGVKAASPSPSPGPVPPSPTPHPPSPTPPSPSTSHYEDPKNGCQADEVDLRIDGIAGEICAPKCGITCRFLNGCPKDVPPGVTATPQHVLKDQRGNEYCALVCGTNSECGENASCKQISGTGICTYDDDGHTMHKASIQVNLREVVV